MGSCRLHPATTVCAATSCTGTVETATRLCNGSGVCLPAAGTRDCSPYLCGPGGTCRASCTSSADCKPGLACIASRCSTIPNLALLWRFEESTGAVATDSSGNGINGTYTGASGVPAPSSNVPSMPGPTYTNSLSRDFTLASRHAVRVTMPALLRPTSIITISAWARVTGRGSVGAEIISGGNAYILRFRPTFVEVAKKVDNGAGADDWVTCTYDTNAVDGRWHHVAGVISANSVKLYLDGTERCSVPESRPFNYEAVGPDLWVGRHGLNTSTSYDLGGNVDEVRIFSRALSTSEIAVLAAGGN
jgi:hypothetical protein